MKATGKRNVNVYCGKVLFDGTQVQGCGAKPSESGYAEYSYNVEGYKDLCSTVSLCPNCEAKHK